MYIKRLVNKIQHVGEMTETRAKKTERASATDLILQRFTTLVIKAIMMAAKTAHKAQRPTAVSATSVNVFIATAVSCSCRAESTTASTAATIQKLCFNQSQILRQRLAKGPLFSVLSVVSMLPFLKEIRCKYTQIFLSETFFLHFYLPVFWGVMIINRLSQC